MEIKINRNLLLGHLQKVSRAISTKTPIESLTGIKFEVDDNKVVLTGSNMDITIKTSILKEKYGDDMNIIEKGMYVLPSKQMIDIIRKLDGDTLHILNNKRDISVVMIRCGRSKFSLKTMNIDSYPRIDMSPDGICIPITSDILESIVNNVAYAASNKETKPILTGINIKYANNTLECVGCDSYRLAKQIITTDLNENQQFQIVVPSNSLKEICGLTAGSDTQFNLYISQRKIVLTADDVIFQSRLIDGNYPDISGIIPKVFKYELKISKSDFISALDRISLLANTKDGYVLMDINKEQCGLYTKDTEYGSGEEIIENIDFNEDNLQVAFRCSFMQDVLKTVRGNEILIRLNGELKPFMVYDTSDTGLFHLITPIRIR